MAREIRKKVIDQEIQSTDDFDEKMLEQIEQEFDQINTTGGNLRSTTDMSGSDFFTSDAAKTGFSLDDFETSIDKGEDILRQQIPKVEPASESRASEASPTSSPKPQTKSKITIARKKIIIMGSALVLVLLIAGFLLAHLLRKPSPSQEPAITRMIRHHITVQLYQEQFDFLILANAQREKDLISLGIEFQFPTVNAFEDFQKENIVFRDVIYQFLQGERPVKNSQKYWQQIVENGLLNYLKAIFPKNGMSSVRMVYLDRL